MEIAEMTDVSAAARLLRLGRHWRVIASVTAALLVIGAFLAYGPIGIGPGPLEVGNGVSQGNTDFNGGPQAFMLPIVNTSHDRAVIDKITLVGATGYAWPRELDVAVLTDLPGYTCGGARPVRRDGRGFSMGGCGEYQSQLIGHSVPHSSGFPAFVEVAAPHSGACWVMTKVIVRYHIGIRHYTTSGLYPLADCARNAQDQVNTATSAGAS